MKFWVINFKLIVFLIFCSVIFNSNTSHAVKNKILFKINNEIITSMDLLQEANYLLAMNDKLNNEKQNVILEDGRYKNEIDELKKKGFYCIKLNMFLL